MKKIAILALLILPIYAFSIGPKHPDKIEPHIIHFELRPGQSVQDTVIVKNIYPDKKINIKINAVDSFLNNKNEISYKVPTQKQTDFGSWTSLEIDELTLAPNESKEVNYKISIPENTELKNYLGGLTITIEGKQSENSAIKSNFRIVQSVKIKVTDNPQPIEKMDLSSKTQINPYQIWFYSSIVLTLIVFSFIIVQKIKTKQIKKTHQSK